MAPTHCLPVVHVCVGERECVYVYLCVCFYAINVWVRCVCVYVCMCVCLYVCVFLYNACGGVGVCVYTCMYILECVVYVLGVRVSVRF